jgi:superoxide dismutase
MFKDIITGGRVERVKSFALLEHIENSFGHKDRFSEKAQNYIKGREKFGVNLVYVDRDKALALLESESRVCTSQESIKKRAKRQFINMIQENELVRTVNKIEMCRLQGFPDNYCDILSTKKSGSLLGDGWTLPIIEHIFSFIKK